MGDFALFGIMIAGFISIILFRRAHALETQAKKPVACGCYWGEYADRAPIGGVRSVLLSKDRV